jgi:mono/diheme cytochrome c family protein
MTVSPPPPHAPADGLWRWLVGGLVGGGVVLGLLVAAYVIGYDRGQHHPVAGSAKAAAPASSAAAGTSGPTTGATGSQAALGPVTATPALVARGKELYTADGCSSCHSLDGTPGAGPSLKGLSASTVKLVNGQTVSADDSYLERAITDPDAQVADGYKAGIMSAAIAGFGLSGKPDDVRALVAFIKSSK